MPSLKKKFQNLLLQDEKLLWVGHPWMNSIALTFFFGAFLLVVLAGTYTILGIQNAMDTTLGNLPVDNTSMLTMVVTMLIIAFLLALCGVIWLRRTTYAITDKRIIFRSVLIFAHITELMLADVGQIELEASIWERLLRLGTINIILNNNMNERFADKKYCIYSIAHCGDMHRRLSELMAMNREPDIS